jgi:hypothetical protein
VATQEANKRNFLNRKERKGEIPMNDSLILGIDPAKEKFTAAPSRADGLTRQT